MLTADVPVISVNIALSEGGAGRVPCALERMDDTWPRTRLGVDWASRPRNLEP